MTKPGDFHEYVIELHIRTEGQHPGVYDRIVAAIETLFGGNGGPGVGPDGAVLHMLSSQHAARGTDAASQLREYQSKVRRDYPAVPPAATDPAHPANVLAFMYEALVEHIPIGYTRGAESLALAIVEWIVNMSSGDDYHMMRALGMPAEWRQLILFGRPEATKQFLSCNPMTIDEYLQLTRLWLEETRRRQEVGKKDQLIATSWDGSGT